MLINVLQVFVSLSSLPLCFSFCLMNMSHFIHSPLDGNLDYFQLELMTNFSVIKTLIYTFWYTQSPFCCFTACERNWHSQDWQKYPASGDSFYSWFTNPYSPRRISRAPVAGVIYQDYCPEARQLNVQIANFLLLLVWLLAWFTSLLLWQTPWP